MKKKIIFITVILSLLLGTIAYGVHLRQVKKELEYLYYRQNTALRLCCDYSKRNYYHDTKELDVNDLAVRVSAYNCVASGAHVTVEEIIDYLSSEFDSEGKPRIYSQPENIEKYIIWCIRAVDIIDDYRIDFTLYLHDNGYTPYWEMSYEEVETHLEEFQKNPEYNSLLGKVS